MMAEDLNEDFDEEAENRVSLLVHNIIPPFLDGRFVYTKQMLPVVPVKDVTADMAVIASKGSKTVRTFREQEERKNAQEKHWELAGSKLGNLMGIKEKIEEDQTANVDYKYDLALRCFATDYS